VGKGPQIVDKKDKQIVGKKDKGLEINCYCRLIFGNGLELGRLNSKVGSTFPPRWI